MATRPEAPAASIAEILENGRKEAGVSQREVFEEYHSRGGRIVERNTVSEWLRGNRKMPADELPILVEAINHFRDLAGLDPLPISFPPILRLMEVAESEGEGSATLRRRSVGETTCSVVDLTTWRNTRREFRALASSRG